MMQHLGLKAWVDNSKLDLERKGYSVNFMEYEQGQCSVNIDGCEYVGTIVYWPEDLYEVQFNNARNGEIALLTTERLTDIDRLTWLLTEAGII